MKIAAWLERASSRLAASRAGPALGKRYGTRKSWKVVTTRALGSAARSSEGSRCTEPPRSKAPAWNWMWSSGRGPSRASARVTRERTGIPALDGAVDGHLARTEDAPGRDARPLMGEDADGDAERGQSVAQARGVVADAAAIGG